MDTVDVKVVMSTERKNPILSFTKGVRPSYQSGLKYTRNEAERKDD